MDLKQLIATTKGERSYEDLARLSGGSPTSQRWHQYATAPMKTFPSPASLRGISRALGVTELTVIKAVAASVGLEVPDREPRFVTLLPARTDQLTQAQVAAIRHVLLVMLEPTDDAAMTPTDPTPEAARARALQRVADAERSVTSTAEPATRGD